MPAIINKIEPDSIAEELDLQPGDEILSMDGSVMLDMIDYNFFCKSEFLTIEIKKITAKQRLLNLRKITMKIWG